MVNEVEIDILSRSLNDQKKSGGHFTQNFEIDSPRYKLQIRNPNRQSGFVDRNPVRILDVQSKQLRGKSINIMKVLWDEKNQEITWELEEDMRKNYPHLFS